VADRVPKQPLTWHLLAEERIRNAQAEGAFDKLPGLGRQIQGIDEPPDELWWVKEKLAREGLQILPPALELRLDVQTTLARIAETAAESEVRHEVAALNERIRRTSFGVTWGPSVDFVPLDVEAVVAEWSARKVTADSPD
jgi:hypothetical protein